MADRGTADILGTFMKCHSVVGVNFRFLCTTAFRPSAHDDFDPKIPQCIGATPLCCRSAVARRTTYPAGVKAVLARLLLDAVAASVAASAHAKDGSKKLCVHPNACNDIHLMSIGTHPNKYISKRSW